MDIRYHLLWLVVIHSSSNRLYAFMESSGGEGAGLSRAVFDIINEKTSFLCLRHRGATGNPFPEVPGRFLAPHSPGNRICLPVPAPVPATIPRGPRKSNFLDIFFFLLKNNPIKPFIKKSKFYKTTCNGSQKFLMYNVDYVLWIRNYAYTWYFYSPIPRPQNPRNGLKIPLSLGNGNLPFPYPPRIISCRGIGIPTPAAFINLLTFTCNQCLHIHSTHVNYINTKVRYLVCLMFSHLYKSW
jgi:hypothetical protein